MTDKFSTYSSSPVGPPEGAAAVTPDDNNDLQNVTTGILIGAGPLGANNADLRVTMRDGTTVLLQNLRVGIIHRIRIRRVHATETNGYNIVAFF